MEEAARNAVTSVFDLWGPDKYKQEVEDMTDEPVTISELQCQKRGSLSCKRRALQLKSHTIQTLREITDGQVHLGNVIKYADSLFGKLYITSTKYYHIKKIIGRTGQYESIANELKQAYKDAGKTSVAPPFLLISIQQHLLLWKNYASRSAEEMYLAFCPHKRIFSLRQKNLSRTIFSMTIDINGYNLFINDNTHAAQCYQQTPYPRLLALNVIGKRQFGRCKKEEVKFFQGEYIKLLRPSDKSDAVLVEFESEELIRLPIFHQIKQLQALLESVHSSVSAMLEHMMVLYQAKTAGACKTNVRLNAAISAFEQSENRQMLFAGKINGLHNKLRVDTSDMEAFQPLDKAGCPTLLKNHKRIKYLLRWAQSLTGVEVESKHGLVVKLAPKMTDSPSYFKL